MRFLVRSVVRICTLIVIFTRYIVIIQIYYIYNKQTRNSRTQLKIRSDWVFKKKTSALVQKEQNIFFF